MTQRKQPTIFYSWQSDLPEKQHHYYIAAALNKAGRAIYADATAQTRPNITSDTQGGAGARRIDEVILAKTKTSVIFVTAPLEGCWRGEGAGLTERGVGCIVLIMELACPDDSSGATCGHGDE